MILLLLLLVLPLTSADILVDKQPNKIYNLGDVATISLTVKSSAAISGSFNMDLVCGSNSINFYKNPIVLSAGQEKKIESSLILTKDLIGDSIGDCKVKAFLGSDSVLTSVFKISDFATVTPAFQRFEFNPGENIFVKGKAVKENGENVNGFVELLIILDSGTDPLVSQQSTVNGGSFTINATLPKDLASGSYLVQINVKEKDIGGIVTNQGSSSQNIAINQVPTTLEIVFENTEVEPGTDLKVKSILHDQTGQKIDTIVFISVKNRNNRVLEQKEVATDEFFEYPITYDESPATWKVVAVSNKLTTESPFSITEKIAADVQIMNKTVLVTNIGNVPYNRTVSISLGNKSVDLSVYVDVGESEKYILTAPDGSYDVKILADGRVVGANNVFLTGNVIDAQKAPGTIGSLLDRNSTVWIFVILVLALFAFIVFRRVYKRNFFGYIGSKIGAKEEFSPLSKNSLVSSRNPAEISMSIKGEKQDVCVVAIHVKNVSDIQNKEGNAQEMLQKIVDLADSEKAVVYESQDVIFFIFAPGKTKTFGNEKTALNFAQKVLGVLEHHNKMFKQDIKFGISLNYGTIVAKQESTVFRFMAMGTLMTSTKKIASIADSEVLIAERLNDRIRSEAKTVKQHKSGIDVFSLKEMKNTEDHSKFIRGFLDRLDKK